MTCQRAATDTSGQCRLSVLETAHNYGSALLPPLSPGLDTGRGPPAGGDGPGVLCPPLPSGPVGAPTLRAAQPEAARGRCCGAPGSAFGVIAPDLDWKQHRPGNINGHRPEAQPTLLSLARDRRGPSLQDRSDYQLPSSSQNLPRCSKTEEASTPTPSHAAGQSQGEHAGSPQRGDEVSVPAPLGCHGGPGESQDLRPHSAEARWGTPTSPRPNSRERADH